MNRKYTILILLILIIGLSACKSNDNINVSNNSQSSSLVPNDSSSQEESAAESSASIKPEQHESELDGVFIGGEYTKLPTPDSNVTGSGPYAVYDIKDVNGKPWNLIHTREGLRYVRYNMETLTYDNGTLFEVPSGEFIRRIIVEGGHVLVVTNRNCYAFDCDSMVRVISKPLPEFLVIEEEENDKYVKFVVDADCNMIAYVYRSEESDSLYICSLTENATPVEIHKTDTTGEVGGHEYYYAISFLEDGRLLVGVGGWEWTWRYEIMDLQGGTLLKIQPPDMEMVATYGSGEYFRNDAEMLMITPPIYEKAEKWYQYYWVDCEQLEIRRLDWINDKLPSQGVKQIGPGESLIAISNDLNYGVICARYIIENTMDVEKTEFYFIDFERETVTLLPQTIENYLGDIIAVAGDYFYFSYYDKEWEHLQGIYAAKLPEVVE